MNREVEELQILVVDDERVIREGSERVLSRLGFHIITAQRGDEALQVFEKAHPAIVLLDLKMPGMEGIDVLKHLRALDPSILVIIITGYATVETAIDAMKHGAYDFISKPFQPEQLRIVVNRAAEKIRLTREAKKLEQEKARTLLDLDTEKSRLRTIIQSLPDGVMVTNPLGQVVLLNRSCKQMLKLPPDTSPGRPIQEYVPDEALCTLGIEISRGKHVDYGDIPEQELVLTDGTYLRAIVQPVLGERRECLGAIFNFVDVTSMKVLERLKSEFVSKITHELRSPLSTIHEQIAMVISDLVDNQPQQHQHLLTRAKEKTQGLLTLIGDLLDLSRIEEGIICREPKPVRLDELLKNIVDFLSARASAKKQSLSFDNLSLNLPEINADPLALESIFGNLITNAITYTPEGGGIRVEMDRAGINVRVKVKDNGFGISEKYIDKIFDRFYRVKDERTRYITGTGLGLSIVKGLMDSLGGIIEVESTPGEGSTFTVLLPIQRG